MVMRTLLLALACAVLALPAHAAGWERPSVNVRVEAVSSSDLFEDSLSTGRASGVSGELKLATSVRSRGSLKWSFEANAGGLAYPRIREASRAWIGGTAGVRHKG